MSREPIFYFVIQDKTVFVPLKFVYPECFVHIKERPQLYPMQCFVTDSCPPGANCGEVLVRRVHYLFQEVVPSAEVLIAYFTYPDRPKSIRAAIFDKDLSPPRLSVLNPYAFRKFQREGTAYQWTPSDEYLFMGGSKGLLMPDGVVVPESKGLWKPK